METGIKKDIKTDPKNYDYIPAELKEKGQFCVWKKEMKDGKPTKVPYNPRTGGYAQVNNPSTFSSFEVALNALKKEKNGIQLYNGIGFKVTDPICAIDLDNCFEEGSSEIDFEGLLSLIGDISLTVSSLLKPWAFDIVSACEGCYIEKSPSGKGLRVLLSAPEFKFDKSIYYINNRKLGLEVYVPGATNRFVTLTGDVFPGVKYCSSKDISFSEDRNSLADKTKTLQFILDKHMKRPVAELENTKVIEPHSYLSDEEIIKKASASVSGERFKALIQGDISGYDSQSNADMALCSYLAFWCGCDEEQMDRIFRTSGLYREKWDRSQSGSTYGAITIKRAINRCTDIYNPVAYLVAPEDEFLKELDRDEEEIYLGTDGEICSEVNSTVDCDEADNDVYKTAAFKDNNDIFDLKSVERKLLLCAKRFVDVRLIDLKPNKNPRYTWTELGTGRLFADYYKRIARFVIERNAWYVFDGKVWKHDRGNILVMLLAKNLVDNMLRYCPTIENETDRSDYIGFIRKLQTRRKREIMIRDAESEYSININEFDRNKLLFNCKNGTLNLATMEFYKHRPEDFITMISGVNYDPAATCPRWNEFVSEVMMKDEFLVLYLQKALGYALTGDTSLECLFILYGATSRNGKGTTMETCLKIMGDYGKTSNPEMLSAKFGNISSGGPSEEIARLNGARFVNISEPEKKITFNAALVKRLTGNDTINARYLHENSFDFKPEFKIFINTNYLPNVSDMTLFDSGRLKIIPFSRHFSEEEQDKTLKSFFAREENLSGIFNWILKGALRLNKEGLDMPEAVLEATRAYRKESDRIGQFIEAWLEKGEAYEVRTSAVFNVYKNWCAENCYRAENAKNFNKALGIIFELKKKRPADGSGEKTSMVLGCRLRADEEAIIQE